MSNLREHPVAVLCADLHLTLRPPICRADKNWMVVQRDYLKQIQAFKCPVICAGDIFDRWNPPPELVNFALRFLPDGMICVPGQHDLPNHNIKDIYRSGYGVLKQAGKIVDLSDWEGSLLCSDVEYTGFGWDQEITGPKDPTSKRLQVAVIHKYVWKTGHSYPDAPEEARIQSLNAPIGAYHVAVFGDNHSGFDVTLKSNTHIFNCGGFIRRKSDEINHKPSVGLLYPKGKVVRHYLDTSNDRFHEMIVDVSREGSVDIADFIKGLEDLGEEGLDFRAAVKHHLESKKVDAATRKIIWQAVEQAA